MGLGHLTFKRVDYCPKSVQTDCSQGENRRKHGHGLEWVENLAHESSVRPLVAVFLYGDVERDADTRNSKVRDSQVKDKIVGYSPHSTASCNHHTNKRISYHADQKYDGIKQ